MDIELVDYLPDVFDPDGPKVLVDDHSAERPDPVTQDAARGLRTRGVWPEAR